MSYVEKAKELGQALLDNEVVVVYKAAEANLDNNPEGLKIIRDFQQSYQRITEAQERGEEPEERDLELFQQAQEQMRENKAIMAYLVAQQNFKNLMQEINNIINLEIFGKGSGGCSEDCSSGCSCSGDCSGCM